MATDFIPELDKDFFKDNLLTEMDFTLADLGNEVDLEFDFSSDYSSISRFLDPLNDLADVSMLQDDQASDHSASSDYFTDIGDASSPEMIVKSESNCLLSSSYIYNSTIKIEPTSPSPSLSSLSSTDSPKSKNGSASPSPEVEIKIEKPLTTVSCKSSPPIPHMVNIQPKTVQSRSPISVSATSCQPLVLTADEFKKLKAQGIFKLQPISAKTGTSTLQPNHGVDKSLTETELKALKKHQRMLKNRESASLSRKKKKEYLLNLEQKLQEQAQINNCLRRENDMLKKQVKLLQSENDLLKKSSSSKIKKTTCLVLLLFLVSLNFSPLSFFNNEDKVIQPPPRARPHWPTRSLLWENAPDFLNDFNNTLDDGITCPKSINKSESLRLADELTGWVKRHEKQLDSKKESKQSARKVFPLKRFNLPIPKNLNNLPRPKIHSNNGNDKRIQIYEWRENPYENFMTALHRRDDTFYVVSFRGDHLLLPATAHNKTQRPRMSLVMPAMPLNETMQPPPNHIAMMQIDCEVMDAKLVHLKESLIPEHLRENQTTAAQAHVMSSLVSQHNKSAKQKKAHSVPQT